MKKKVAALIDGGHLRAVSKSYGVYFNCDFIEDFCKSLPVEDEEINKILYYDCRPFNGVKFLPVSGREHQFTTSGTWLDDLAGRDLFAVRLGQLKFRGWTLKDHPQDGRQYSDSDFKANFEQKGVDMRLGLDISNIAYERTYDRLLIVTGDSDMIPALKEARKAGVQVVLYQLPYAEQRAHRDKLKHELRAHSDYVRNATWPANHLPRPKAPAA